MTDTPKVPQLGERSTRQRAAVFETLQQMDAFSSARQVHAQLTARGDRAGLTTVYRTLQSLADIGAVDMLRSESGEALYRRCASERHHHHLVCTHCGTAVEIDGGPIEQWSKAEATRHGFTNVSHVAEVFGLCANCRAAG